MRASTVWDVRRWIVALVAATAFGAGWIISDLTRDEPPTATTCKPPPGFGNDRVDDRTLICR